jgi:hypothetical protein
MSITIEKFEGSLITDNLITAAAEFFTLNYGVWGRLAANKIGVKEGMSSFFFFFPRIVSQSLTSGESLFKRLAADFVP